MAVKTFAIGCCLLAFWGGSGSAGVVGGVLWQADLDPFAFADTVIPVDLSRGSFFAGGSGSLLDGDLVTGWLYLAPGDRVVLGFTDNLVFNGQGDDIALFEWGLPESAVVRVPDPTAFDGWSESLVMDSYPTGSPLLNVLLVDLSDFGLERGATVEAVLLEGVGSGFFELSGAAALHDLPLPGGSPLEFFDGAVAAGALYGIGPGRSADGRLGALRDMIRAAERDGSGQDPVLAAGSLREALARVDGLPHPPDFAAGPAAPLLADRLRSILEGCLFP